MIKAKQLLVSVPTDLDELCFCTPAIRALTNHSDIENITIFCATEHEALWKKLAREVNTHTNTKALEKGRYDSALILHDNAKSAKVLSKGKIPNIYGLPTKETGKFLTKPIDLVLEPQPIVHRVRHYLQILEELDVHTRDRSFFPAIRDNVHLPAKRVLLVASSNFGSSYEWPLERHAELLTALLKSNLSVDVCDDLDTGPKSTRATHLLESVDAPNSQRVTFDTYEHALSSLTEYDLCISSDAFLPHIATFAGTPCLTIFGPNEPAWKRPLGTFHKIIREHVACSPCFSATCAMDMRCQNEIYVSQVINAI